jgi:cytochrome c peroxidase
MPAEDRDAIDQVFARIGKSIAAYTRRLVSHDSPFDRFIAAVRAGDAERAAQYDPAAREGLRLFVGAARCIRCHSGPTLSDREFHDNRVPTATGAPRRDPGRQRGIAQVQDDPFNAAGRHSDAPDGAAAEQLRYLPRAADSFSHFKTPTLRDVAVTGPYMHQGQFGTLDEVLSYYDTLERAVPTHSPERTLAPLHMTPTELAALRAFLESLTGAPLPPELTSAPETPWLPE